MAATDDDGDGDGGYYEYKKGGIRQKEAFSDL